VPHPVVSSLHASCVPEQLELRRYRTVSNVVAVALHVEMVATPETAGVHWKTRSGAVLGGAQSGLCALAPPVTPLQVPPWAGTTVAPRHGAGAGSDSAGGVTVSAKLPLAPE